MKKSTKKSSNRSMLFLAELRWLAQWPSARIKNQPKIRLNPEIIKDNLYVIYAKEMVRAGFINQADLYYFDIRYQKEKIEVEDGIIVHTFNQIDDCFDKLKSFYNFVFYRGNYNEWNDVLKKTKADKYLFYAADSKYWPRFFDQKYLDIIYLDENDQKHKINKLFPKSRIVILDKTVNPDIFYPSKDGKKNYDICYPGNFMPWKEHGILFSAINKIKEKDKIKIICPGKTFDRRKTIEIWAKKYGVNVILPESLPPKELAQVMRQSKIGVIPNELDANPRTITEMIACGLPIVANKNLTGGLKLINKNTGLKTSVDNLPKVIEQLIKNYNKYSTAKYFKKYFLPAAATKHNFIDPLK